MRGFLRFAVWVIGILAVIGFVLHLTVIDTALVADDDPTASASIEPTLHAGDRIFVFRKGALKDGYLVRCGDPDAPGRHVIGRIGGTNGEAVQVVGGALSINGKRVAAPRGCGTGTVMMRHPVTGADLKLECHVEETAGTEHEFLTLAANTEVAKSVVETGKVYLVSDNRYLHLDSRDFGQIDPATCQHIVYRLWGAAGYFDTSQRFTTLW